MAQVHTLLGGEGENLFDEKPGVIRGGIRQEDAQPAGINDANGIGGANAGLQQFDQTRTVPMSAGPEDGQRKFSIFGCGTPNAIRRGLWLATFLSSLCRGRLGFQLGCWRGLGGQSLWVRVVCFMAVCPAGLGGGPVGAGALPLNQEQELLHIVQRNKLSAG
jgi:hypothetical protein